MHRGAANGAIGKGGGVDAPLGGVTFEIPRIGTLSHSSTLKQHQRGGCALKLRCPAVRVAAPRRRGVGQRRRVVLRVHPPAKCCKGWPVDVHVWR